MSAKTGASIPVLAESALVKSVKTSGKVTSVRSWCELKGQRLRGKDAGKLCNIDVIKRKARVLVEPVCSVGLTYHVKITAKEAGKRATKWTREWKVRKDPAIRCSIKATG